jgi:rhodanese-related sulfurtransferase
MDMFYNHLVRPLFGATRIPPNPFQRRLACLSAAMINIAAGMLLLMNLTTAAYLLGGLLLVLQAIVISTHFCALSWVYELLAILAGKWHRPVEKQEAKSLLENGATLVDVRSPLEFAEEHLPGAVNIPLETLPEKLAALPEGPVLLHCKSGMRSNVATGMLKKRNFSKIHNIGSYQRAKQIIEIA